MDKNAQRRVRQLFRRGIATDAITRRVEEEMGVSRREVREYLAQGMQADLQRGRRNFMLGIIGVGTTYTAYRIVRQFSEPGIYLLAKEKSGMDIGDDVLKIPHHELKTIISEEQMIMSWEKVKDTLRNQPYVPPVRFKDAYLEDRIVPEPDATYAERISEHIRKSVCHLQSYVQHPLISGAGPTIVHGQTLSDFERDYSSLTMILAGTIKQVSITSWEYPLVSGEEGIALCPVEAHMLYGRNLRKTSIQKNLDGTASILTTNANAIYFCTRGDPVRLLRSPLLEYLHYLVSPVTFGHVGQFLSKPGNFITKEDGNTVLNRWCAREERVVHAIGAAWFEEYGRTLRIPDAAVQALLREEDRNQTYTGTAQMTDLVWKKGPGDILDQYQQDPDSLFLEAGLKRL